MQRCNNPVQHAQACLESSKMADNESVSALLTIESLVKELGKFRKDMTGEFIVLLNSSLEPIKSIGTTLITQAATISEIESGLSDHSDRITQLEQDVNALQSKLIVMEKENTTLKANVEDLVSRSNRPLHMSGRPIVVGIEGKSAREFMTNLLSELLGDGLAEPSELDRAHHSLRPKPRTDEAPRPLIIRFHRYIVKETVMRWAKSHKVISYKGHQIKMYEDFSTELAKKRAQGARFRMLYHARLRGSCNVVERIVDSPEAAESFYRQNFPS
uniref:L1 transposable element RRM domain-containing protein n=1 Tax=Sinocyclocheilus grahami TaxID=75366 RepID=A0A672L0N1_SINGR